MLLIIQLNACFSFTLPGGKPKIAYNAHRIYSYDQIIEYFKEFTLVEFALLPDNDKDGTWITNASREIVNEQ